MLLHIDLQCSSSRWVIAGPEVAVVILNLKIDSQGEVRSSCEYVYNESGPELTHAFGITHNVTVGYIIKLITS